MALLDRVNIPSGFALNDACVMNQDELRYTICDGGLPVRIIVIDHRDYATEDVALTAAYNLVQQYHKSEFFVVVVALTPYDRKKTRRSWSIDFEKPLSFFEGFVTSSCTNIIFYCGILTLMAPCCCLTRNPNFVLSFFHNHCRSLHNVYTRSWTTAKIHVLSVVCYSQWRQQYL